VEDCLLTSLLIAEVLQGMRVGAMFRNSRIVNVDQQWAHKPKTGSACVTGYRYSDIFITMAIIRDEWVGVTKFTAPSSHRRALLRAQRRIRRGEGVRGKDPHGSPWGGSGVRDEASPCLGPLDLFLAHPWGREAGSGGWQPYGARKLS
jgi:hypothetical protein